jgi:CheY-like chemotaxis protein
MKDTRQKSVLLIDDDQATNYFHRLMMKETIANANINIAIDGEHALQYITCNVDYAHLNTMDLPNLIVLDLNMPRMGGFAFLEVMKHLPEFIREQIVVLVLTTTDNEESKGQAMKYDMVKDYLQKPLSKNQIVDIASKYFEMDQAA